MAEKTLFTVSASPHAKGNASTRGVMLDVLIALVPAGFAGVAVFGLRALAVMAVSVGTALLSEFLIVKLLKKPFTLGDLSAAVTGLLLAYNLPVTAPLWMAAIGAVVAIVVVKHFFGGLGQNFANPAITARIVLLVSFAKFMTNFPDPTAPDAVASATPLNVLGKLDLTSDVAFQISRRVSEGALPGAVRMLFGSRGGCIGEVCGVALLLGAVYLLVRRVISLTIPGFFIGTVAVMSLIFSHGSLTYTFYALTSGGLLLGAFFMATDYVTSPINFVGKIVFGIGCGLLTSVIRRFGSLPEGVSYAILLMNILTPLIERITRPTYFGKLKVKKEKKAKGGDAA